MKEKKVPEKENLEELDLEKKRKRTKAAQPVKRKVFAIKNKNETSESELSDDISIRSESSSDYDINAECNLLEKGFEDGDQELKNEDFVLVRFQANKKNFYYIGTILRIETSEAEIKFLRSHKVIDKFIFPNVDDISIVNKRDIVLVLPKPTLAGTKRHQSYFHFEVNFSSLEVG